MVSTRGDVVVNTITRPPGWSRGLRAFPAQLGPKVKLTQGFHNQSKSIEVFDVHPRLIHSSQRTLRI